MTSHFRWETVETLAIFQWAGVFNLKALALMALVMLHSLQRASGPYLELSFAENDLLHVACLMSWLES